MILSSYRNNNVIFNRIIEINKVIVNKPLCVEIEIREHCVDCSRSLQIDHHQFSSCSTNHLKFVTFSFKSLSN